MDTLILCAKFVLQKYLKPVDQIPDYNEKQKAITTELNLLRNKAAMLFFLVNALFVTVIFILETVAEYSSGV